MIGTGTLKLTALAFASAAMTGCGGASINFEALEQRAVANSFASVDDAQTLVSSIFAQDPSVTERGDVPTSGTISYNGFMSVTTGYLFGGELPPSRAPVALDLDFSGTGSIGGVATNFIDFRGDPIEGRIVISAQPDVAVLDETTRFQISARAVGELVPADGDTRSYDNTLIGFIKGDQAERIDMFNNDATLTLNGETLDTTFGLYVVTDDY